MDFVVGARAHLDAASFAEALGRLGVRYDAVDAEAAVKIRVIEPAAS